MAEEMKGTNISSPLVPFTKDDKYATHDETFGRGGYRSVSSIAEMNAIPAERRKEGMLVNVLNDRIYQLKNNSFVDAGLGSGGGGTPAPSGTGHNLNIDIRIRRTDSSAQYPHQQYLQYRINEIVENGYICFLRKKRCSNSKMNQITNKYTIPYFSFNHAGNGPTLAYDERTIIPVDSYVKVGEWNTFPDNIDMYIKKTNDSIYFTGDVHANPNEFVVGSTGTGVSKHTSVLKIALQYCIINPNYVNSIKENGKIPMSILESGNLAKLKARLMNNNDHNINSGYKVIFSVD